MQSPRRSLAQPPAAGVRSRIGWLVLLAAGAILVAACGGEAKTPGPSSVDLQGTTWRAILIRDVAPLIGAEPTIRFDGNQTAGTTGCNTYGGTFRLDPDGAFRIDSLFMTEMACDDARGAQETAVIQILSAVDRLELVDGALKLSGPSGSITFTGDSR